MERGQEVYRVERADPSCPSSAMSRGPAPQPSFAAGHDQGATGRGPPRPAPRRRLPGQLPLQTLDLSLRESWRFGSHQEPQVAPQEQAASSVLPGGRPRPTPSQSTPELPASQPSPCPLPPHSPPGGSGRARLGPAGPTEDRGGTTGRAGPGALRGRADAQAPSRPRSRTDPRRSAHPPAPTGGARRAGSAADASAGARGIPGMRRRPPSPGLRRAPPGHAPWPAPPAQQVGAGPR